MRRYISYIKYIVLHKWYVFRAGLSLGVPFWQLILHDWTKFSFVEFFSYSRTYRSLSGEKRYCPDEYFWRGWNHHQKRNKHHWQHWILIKDSGEFVALEIPARHKKEMLVDWIGAGRAITGKNNIHEWYATNVRNIILHPHTRWWVEATLANMMCEKETPRHGRFQARLMANEWLKQLWGISVEQALELNIEDCVDYYRVQYELV